MEGPLSSFNLEFFTYAAGSLVFGPLLGGQWCAERWPEEWRGAGFLKNLVLTELFPVIVMVEIWSIFRDQKIRLHCDNMEVVQVVNHVTATLSLVVRLLRHLVLRCLQLNIFLYAVHIPELLMQWRMPFLGFSGTDSRSWYLERSSMGVLVPRSCGTLLESSQS